MRPCEEYQELISAMLDGELTEAERAEVTEHLAVCPECSAMYDAFAAVSAADAAEVPDTLHAAVMTRVTAAQKALRTQSRLVRLRPVFTAAACLVVIVGTLFAGKTALHRGSAAQDTAVMTEMAVVTAAGAAEDAAPAEAPMVAMAAPEAAWDSAEEASAEAPEPMPECGAAANEAGYDVLVTHLADAAAFTVEVAYWEPEFFVGTVTDAGSQSAFATGDGVTVWLEENTALYLPDGTVFAFGFDLPNADECGIPAGTALAVTFDTFEYAPDNGDFNCVYALEIRAE